MLAKLKQFAQRFLAALTLPGSNAAWQAFHVVLGLLAPALLYLVWPHWYMVLSGVALTGVLYGFPKEFWWDPKYEKVAGQTRAEKIKEGWDDLYHIWSGNGLALALYAGSRLAYWLAGVR